MSDQDAASDERYGVTGGYIEKTRAELQADNAALQARVREAEEALDCVLREQPLPSGEYVHHVFCNGDRKQPPGTQGVSCSCKVGTARHKHYESALRGLPVVEDRGNGGAIEVVHYGGGCWRVMGDARFIAEFKNETTARVFAELLTLARQGKP